MNVTLRPSYMAPKSVRPSGESVRRPPPRSVSMLAVTVLVRASTTWTMPGPVPWLRGFWVLPLLAM